MIADCMAIVMAGGESQRMGCDKATLKLGEQTLLQRVVGIVQPLFPQVLVSVRHPRTDIEWPQVCDRFVSAGPLAGMCAGLERAQEEHFRWIFMVATDMPFIRPALIEYLAQQRTGWQAVVPVVREHPQPLAGFYSTEVLVEVRKILTGDGRHSVRAALEQMSVNYVDESELLVADPGLRSFFDLDTPQDLAAAERQRQRPCP